VSTLSSASTDAQVLAAYDDNASYEEDASSTKAAAFVTACRFLLRRMAKKSGDGTLETELSPDLIREELCAAQAWLSANGGASTGGVIHLSCETFRD